MLGEFAAVGAGAVFGAWLRWGLGHALNPLFPSLLLGTLVANLAGGFAIGVVLELAARHALLSPEARLFVVTGFLGSLTTFSAFSGEAAAAVLRGEWVATATVVASHVVGSIALTLAGIALVRWAFPAPAP